jgi:hypothetical protein
MLMHLHGRRRGHTTISTARALLSIVWSLSRPPSAGEFGMTPPVRAAQVELPPYAEVSAVCAAALLKSFSDNSIPPNSGCSL